MRAGSRCAQGGGVVLASGADVGGPQRPAVGCGDDLHVPAVVGVMPDHHRSTPAVGPRPRQRSVSISVPSTLIWLCPAIFAASSAERWSGRSRCRWPPAPPECHRGTSAAPAPPASPGSAPSYRRESRGVAVRHRASTPVRQVRTGAGARRGGHSVSMAGGGDSCISSASSLACTRRSTMSSILRVSRRWMIAARLWCSNAARSRW